MDMPAHLEKLDSLLRMLRNSPEKTALVETLEAAMAEWDRLAAEDQKRLRLDRAAPLDNRDQTDAGYSREEVAQDDEVDALINNATPAQLGRLLDEVLDGGK